MTMRFVSGDVPLVGSIHWDQAYLIPENVIIRGRFKITLAWLILEVVLQFSPSMYLRIINQTKTP